MPKKNYTHISVLVDRSGSMGPVRDDMIGGLTKFFADQAEVKGKCLVDYSQFDDQYEEVFEDTLVASAVPVLEPRGMTALLDALGRKITSLDAKLSAMSDKKRPGKVMVIIVTDGFENASREYSTERIKEMIEHQSKIHDWEFVFLGANIDAVATAKTYGIKPASAIRFDTRNTSATMDSLNTYSASYRMAGSAAFTDEDRVAAMAQE